MIGFETQNVFIDLANTEFKCPHCDKIYNDDDDKYLKKCNKNKSCYTKVKCECGKPFCMTYNYMGDAVSFL